MPKVSSYIKEFKKKLKGKCGYCPFHGHENEGHSKSHPHIKKWRAIRNWKETKKKQYQVIKYKNK